MAIGHIPRGTELPIVGDFNRDLELLDGNGRDKDITAVMATEILDDMA